MTLPEFEELAAYWRKYPPAHLLLRAIAGFKNEDRRPNDLGGLLATLGKNGAGTF
jgi:hypothetical protein